MDITKSIHSGSKFWLKSIDDNGNYNYALELKAQGKLAEAEKILLSSCIPPSIFYGHYSQLFIIWRIYNKNNIENKKYRKVIDKIKTMIQLNDQMIACMDQYWSSHFNQKFPAGYFDIYSNIIISDANTLLKAAESINDLDSMKLAVRLINEFIAKKH